MLTVDLLGLAALSAASVALVRGDLSAWQPALALALLVPALLWDLPLGVGDRRLHIGGLIEAALLLCLAAGVGSVAVLAMGAAALVQGLRRRAPLDRLLFNVAAHAGPAAAGLALLHLVAGSGAHGLVDLPALSGAVTVYVVLNLLVVTWVVSAATGERMLPTLREDALTTLVGLLANLALAGLVLAAVHGERWELAVAAPFVLTALVKRYRARLTTDTTSDALTRLRLASRGLDSLDEDGAFAEVLERAASLFGLDRVQLVLLDWPDAGDRTLTRTGAGAVDVEPGRPGAPAPSELVAPLVLGGGEAATCIGELRLGFTRPPALTQTEQDVLETFAATTAASLGHTRSYAEQVRAARLDPLTGLPNRLALHERLEALLPELLDGRDGRDGRRSGPGVAVLLFDLDHFKEVNDSLGHGAGDAMLVQVAERLRASVRPGDLVTRLGGDEFAVLVRDCPTGRHARSVAEKLLKRLGAPVHVDGLELPVEASVGVALAPRDGTAVDELLRCADVAMYRAKDKRNTAVAYDPSLDPAEESIHLVGELQAALKAGQLTVHYQPLVDVRTARAVGAEALVRWEHPVHGLLMPGRFIGPIERTALIVPMTLAVLEQAVAEAATWPAVDGEHPTLSVNLSPRCLLVRNLPDQVVRILAKHGLPARRLILEITETLAMSDLEVVEEVLTRLRDLGVQLSVDDFGTGYSSMSFLRRIAVHEVKIDRSFVAQAPTSPGDAAIVRATVELAHGLGLTVVGEGVETARQLRMLRDTGCDLVQGFLLARPVPADEVRALLGQPNAAVLEALLAVDEAEPRIPSQR